MNSAPPPSNPGSMSKRIATTISIVHDDPLLPYEIIFEILLRLPVEVLLRMKCVSKSWFSLISSSQFIRTHLKFQANDKQYAHHMLLSVMYWPRFKTYDRLFSSKKRYSFRSYSLNELLYEESPCLPIKLDDLGYLADAIYRILGSCDGLFLISKATCYSDQELFLWNPATGKSKQLPSSGRDLCTRIAYGFGYVECQNDYKIVAVVGSKSSYRITEVRVYSLRSNSWRRIQEYSSIPFSEPVTFVKGNIHWIAFSDGIITRFNLRDETFGNVALPNTIGKNWKLVNTAGNLGMTCDYKNKKDVWIMKEYGLVESWTKVASIPKFVTKVVWPNFISHNDEILLQDVSGLVWWYVSRDNDTFERPENQARCGDKGELNLYVESLVSPNFLEEV